MNRGSGQAANEASSRAIDSQVARAKVCPSCGRLLALGHFALCPEEDLSALPLGDDPDKEA